MSNRALTLTLNYITQVEAKLDAAQDVQTALAYIDQLRRLRETARRLGERKGAPS